MLLLSVVMLNVLNNSFMLIVILLIVIMLNVVALHNGQWTNREKREKGKKLKTLWQIERDDGMKGGREKHAHTNTHTHTQIEREDREIKGHK